MIAETYKKWAFTCVSVSFMFTCVFIKPLSCLLLCNGSITLLCTYVFFAAVWVSSKTSLASPVFGARLFDERIRPPLFPTVAYPVEVLVAFLSSASGVGYINKAVSDQSI